MSVTCNYCGEAAKYVSGELLYPHRPDLFVLRFWYCDSKHEPAYVGVHKGTKKPLGILANAELRQAKMAAHRAFDALWKSGEMTRKQAYAWLARQLEIPREECHIGMFNVFTCDRVVKIMEHRNDN